MNLPNFLTVSRIFLAPVFFLLLFIPVWTGLGFLPLYILAWVIFLYIEVSDVVDGYLARKMGLVSELGKNLDPFSDVISRMTYFVAFVALAIMPVWMMLIILYRELSITFMRSVLFGRGIAMASRKGGKLKATLYGIAGGAGLVVLGIRGFAAPAPWGQVFDAVSFTVFAAAVLASVVSFVDYIIVFLRLYRGSAASGDKQPQ
jgi:CDP-diacylglycerol--glycerol-3-phosphate 3-phosphatidyltransferase